MAIQAKKQNPWFVILLIVAAVVLWAIDQQKGQPQYDSSSGRPPKTSTKPAPPPGRASPTSGEKATKGGTSSGSVSRRGRYEIYRNCSLAADKTNDGDSFRVLLPDGRQEIFRLYFVDTPESDFKSYRNGENNHDRIRDQAAYFGTDAEAAVEVGKKGKHFTLDLLGKRPFTLYTEWDSPFRDQRYHAFIEVNDGGKPRWLHELLVERGFARLKTKPAELPNGTNADSHRRYLENLQASARKARSGGWGANIPAGVR